MREILFRGKSKDTGKWVYGNLIQQAKMFYIGVLDLRTKERKMESYGEPLDIFVDPKTVGQYTGITDINEKKIFEKDIVKVELADGEYFTTGYIREDEASFVVFGKDKGKAMSVSDEYEVIGNLCDNPELSKEV